MTPEEKEVIGRLAYESDTNNGALHTLKNTLLGAVVKCEELQMRGEQAAIDLHHLRQGCDDSKKPGSESGINRIPTGLGLLFVILVLTGFTVPAIAVPRGHKHQGSNMVQISEKHTILIEMVAQAKCYMVGKDKDYEKARTILVRAGQECGYSNLILFDLGMCRIAMKEWDELWFDCAVTEANEPTSCYVHTYRGLYYLNHPTKKDKKKAKVEFVKAMELGDKKAYYHLEGCR